MYYEDEVSEPECGDSPSGYHEYDPLEGYEDKETGEYHTWGRLCCKHCCFTPKKEYSQSPPKNTQNLFANTVWVSLYDGKERKRF